MLPPVRFTHMHMHMVIVIISNSTWPSRWQLLYLHEAAFSTALLLHLILVLSYFQLRSNDDEVNDNS